MRTRNIYDGLVMTAAALLCLAGCKKDEEGEKIMLGTQFEKAVSAQKTYLGENNTVCWSAGDEVNVNGTAYPVSAEGIAVEEKENGYAAVYPATEGNTLTYTGDVCGKNCTGGTVVIPATQTYTLDEQSGKQVLNGPMAARLAGQSGTLYFRNLYSLLKVTVSADDKAFTVNSITVTATGETPKALAGTYGFSFGEQSTTEAAPTVNPYTNEDKDSSKSVKLTGINTPVAVNNDVDFYLVAHPMTSQNLTVKVEGVLDGKMVVYTYHTASARSLNRNSIGGLAVNLQQLQPEVAYEFSVSSTLKVSFSPGNLQYLACNSTAGDLKHQTVEGEANGMFRFAEHQWDYIGKAAGNTTASDRDKQSDWIDLFGWGTSGYDNKYPYMTSTTNPDYVTGESDIAETYYDWGVYNAIYNPQTRLTDPKGTWRTLTNAEWKYLLNTSGSTRGGKHTDWWIYNMVEITDIGSGVTGLIIYPDGIIAQPDGLSVTLTKNNKTAVNITKAEFEKLEALGCVFLPAAGFRSGTFVINAGSNGDYWSSTYYYSFYACSLYFSSGDVGPNGNDNRYCGRSVRLVKDVE